MLVLLGIQSLEIHRKHFLSHFLLFHDDSQSQHLILSHQIYNQQNLIHHLYGA
ncbi:hypothetical protein COK_2167 [Mannheimia haemolytica serotype A2 str. BOVINE]|nr:hypothetical protein COK_2167 [Mannheimia haemolytica serotype A2 str. BOVINE]